MFTPNYTTTPTTKNNGGQRNATSSETIVTKFGVLSRRTVPADLDSPFRQGPYVKRGKPGAGAVAAMATSNKKKARCTTTSRKSSFPRGQNTGGLGLPPSGDADTMLARFGGLAEGVGQGPGPRKVAKPIPAALMAPPPESPAPCSRLSLLQAERAQKESRRSAAMNTKTVPAFATRLAKKGEFASTSQERAKEIRHSQRGDKPFPLQGATKMAHSNVVRVERKKGYDYETWSDVVGMKPENERRKKERKRKRDDDKREETALEESDLDFSTYAKWDQGPRKKQQVERFLDLEARCSHPNKYSMA
ncbi:hypothetical protein MKZ38_004503 [Zalerion maritima]|uniref:Uncharacterized protein n=1 Tax=Zalerion maritima TaxID=339359 RepID=A0AAD5RMH2_9PEZI|nr:hypothetical protein MKZ38_004503 [Zalerion maritima]